MKYNNGIAQCKSSQSQYGDKKNRKIMEDKT